MRKEGKMQLEDSESGKWRPGSWWPVGNLWNGFVCDMRLTENRCDYRDGDQKKYNGSLTTPLTI